MEEWKEHFKILLEGVRVDSYEEDKEEQEALEDITEEEKISIEEVREQIKKLKKKKASGEDQLENEAWIYGGEKVVERLTEIINKVWKGEGFPDRWKEGVISPIFKKGDRDNVKNYRGITILNTAYKIYAMILEKRLKA